MTLDAFPIVSLRKFETAGADGKKVLALEIDAICRTTGFLAIADHGVPQATIDAVWNAAKDFFDEPVEVKQAARAPYPGYPYGYLGPDSEALAASRGVATPPDLKESFNGGPLVVPPGMTDAEALSFCYAPTIWPQAPEGFRPAWQAYYIAMEDLAARIMRLFAAALTLPEDYFAGVIDHPVSALRALNYPEQRVAPKTGTAARRRPLGLWQPDDPAAAGRQQGAADRAPGWLMARRAADSRRLRHQHRRSDAALDQ